MSHVVELAAASRRPRSPAEQRLARCAELASRHFAVTTAALRAKRRGSPPVIRARQVAMYLAHVGCGLPQVEVAAWFGRPRRDVSYACHAVEDLRDDAAFDAALLALEGALARGARR
jgi:chromosomal replication initiation ATPase DnaA